MLAFEFSCAEIHLLHLVQQLVCKVSSVLTGISVSNLKAMRLSTILTELELGKLLSELV